MGGGSALRSGAHVPRLDVRGKSHVKVGHMFTLNEQFCGGAFHDVHLTLVALLAMAANPSQQ